MKQWLIMLVWLASQAAAHAAVQTATHVTSWSMITNNGNRQVFFQLASGGTVEVSPYAPDVVRVRYHFSELFPREEIAIHKFIYDWPNFTQTFAQVNATNFVITTDQLHISIVLTNQVQVHFYTTNGVPILLDSKMEFNLDYNQIGDTNAYAQISWGGGAKSVSNFPSGFKLRGTKRMGTNDAFFGLGDTAGPLNRRGRAIQFWTQDTYAFSEEKTPRYTALPMMYGVRPASTNHPAMAYGFFFNNPARPVFRLDGTNGVWTFEAGDDQLDYFFFAGGSNHTMEAVIDRFSELTGRPKMLPKWALGYHQSRHSYFTQNEVMDIATTMRATDFPCDAIYLDIGAQAQYTNQNAQLTFGAEFTNVAQMVGDIDGMGMKLVPIVEPLLTLSDPLYAHAASNLYFLKSPDLSNYIGSNFLGFVSWLDYSIPATRDWWRGRLTNYLDSFGFEALWNDLNEPNENDLLLNVVWYLDNNYGATNVDSTVKWHAVNKNTYSIWESRVSYEALTQSAPAKRPYVLSRSAWPGIQRYAAGWSGDNISSFDHLRFSNPFGLNVMISGQAWYGHDIGGFVGDAYNELIARWVQAGSLQPLFRNHTTLGTTNQEPWAFSADYVQSNRRWIKFRYQMMPYLYSLAARASSSGVPVNAPAVFFFQQDTNTFTRNDYDYMVGRDLLVAPVYESGESLRSVYLPSGSQWYHQDTGRKYAGGQTVSVPASLAYMPLFSRAGAIIPVGPVQYFANQFAPAHIDIHHWPGTNSFLFYEDDGETTNYLAGAYARTLLTANSSTGSLSFTIGNREGSFDPGARDYYLIMHDANPVTALTVGGSPLARRANRSELASISGNGWSYSWFERRLTVKLADAGLEQNIAATFSAYPDLAEPIFSTTYTNMAVAGHFNFWNQRAANMRKTATNQWGFVADLTGCTNVAFKFVANDAWEVANWGDGDTNQIAELDGADIILPGALSGWYTFAFNETSLAYSVTSAWSSDLDHDGMPDAYEAYHGLNPYSADDAALDPDGDGFSNLREYVAGTSIIDAGSYFYITGSGDFTLEWSAVSGRRYAVSYATNLILPDPWQALLPYTNITGAGTISVTDTSPAPFKAYRVRVEIP